MSNSSVASGGTTKSYHSRSNSSTSKKSIEKIPIISAAAQEMDEKRKRKLERNRESARECRKRKKDRMIMLKQNISKLESDNLQLRLKLQIGPESEKQQNDEASQHFYRLERMISDGVSENEIKKSLNEIQEKFADYGRDRRSTMDFHVAQLRRCLEPTQTTKTILWLMNYAPTYYNSDGTLRLGMQDEAVELWKDLHNTLNPSQEQCRQLVQLAVQPFAIQRASEPVSPTSSSSSSSSSSASSATPELDLESSNHMLRRLEILLSDKNESLDLEMGQLQHILSASQIARFLVWINKNPSVMQMLECLWPHVTEEAER